MQTLKTGSSDPGSGSQTLDPSLWIRYSDPAVLGEEIIIYHCILSYFGAIKQLSAKI